MFTGLTTGIADSQDVREAYRGATVALRLGATGRLPGIPEPVWFRLRRVKGRGVQGTPGQATSPLARQPSRYKRCYRANEGNQQPGRQWNHQEYSRGLRPGRA